MGGYADDPVCFAKDRASSSPYGNDYAKLSRSLTPYAKYMSPSKLDVPNSTAS